MSSMDHTDATLTGAAERYILGEMDARERDRYEAHFFDCVECADEVRAAARFVDIVKTLLLAPADQSIAPGHTAVRDAEPAWWRSLLGAFRPLPLAAAATVLLAVLVGYQSLILIPGLRQQLHDADGVQAAPAFFLSVARGEPPLMQLTPGDRRVSVTLSRTFGRAFPYYRVDMLNAAGRTIESRSVRGGGAGEELTVSIPVLGLPAGSYAIVVAGLESESNPVPASDSVRYPFTLGWRDPPH